MKDQIKAAEGGDRAAAKYLVARAADDLSRGISLDEDLALWLGACLTQISEGVKPGRALGISENGRPPKDDCARMVEWQCFAETERLLASGRAETVTEAAAIVAEFYGLEISTVISYRKRERSALQNKGVDTKSVIEVLVNPDLFFSRMSEAVAAIPEEERRKYVRAAAVRMRSKQ